MGRTPMPSSIYVSSQRYGVLIDALGILLLYAGQVFVVDADE